MKDLNIPQLVLLDRDGVLNVDRPDSVKSIEEFILKPRVALAIRQLNQHNIKVAVVTNQAVVGRGVISEATLEDIHAHMLEQLKAQGATIDKIYSCLSPDSDHPDRKPNPGLLEKAIHDFKAIPDKTPLIGDALRDLEAAKALHCPRYLVLTGKGQKTLNEGLPDHVQPVTICNDLMDAIDKILGQ